MLTTTHRWAGATAITAVLMVGGAGIASAQEPTPPTQEPSTLTAEQSARICQERIPALLARIDRAAARITGDASTIGSTAWLQERAADARDAGRTERADRFDTRAAARTELLDRLADGGPGLAPDEYARVFDRGLLHERYRDRRPVGGAGVGLALVHGLVTRMGGTITAGPALEGARVSPSASSRVGP